jgi:sulfonate dioxygenase
VSSVFIRSNPRSANADQANGFILRPSYPEYLGEWIWDYRSDPYRTPLENVFQPAALADPKKPHLLRDGAKVSRITPKFGTVVDGVQLSSLSAEGKNELSLLVAERGVVVFRNQDFADMGSEKLIEYCRYFGPLHIFPAAEFPPGYPELHPFYRVLGSNNNSGIQFGPSGIGYATKKRAETYIPRCR